MSTLLPILKWGGFVVTLISIAAGAAALDPAADAPADVDGVDNIEDKTGVVDTAVVMIDDVGMGARTDTGAAGDAGSDDAVDIVA